MARVNEAKYSAMISALYTFSSNVYTASSEMQTLASACAQVLGEEDSGVQQIYSKIRGCQLQYAEACAQAKKIAAAMQEELDEAKREQAVWASDEE